MSHDTVKHQLQVVDRSRCRAPRLTPWDRLVFGLCACCIPIKRLAKCAVILKPSIMRFHRALCGVSIGGRMLQENGTLRREYLDRLFFWSGTDLERKLLAYCDYYSSTLHSGLSGETPRGRNGESGVTCNDRGLRMDQHCHGMFHLSCGIIDSQTGIVTELTAKINCSF